MSRLNGAANRFQIGLRHWPTRMRRRQHGVQMLAELPGLVRNASAGGAREFAQALGERGFNQLCQLGKPNEVSVGGQVLNG